MHLWIKKEIISYFEKIRLEIVFSLLFGAVLYFYLFLPPNIGLADSADFGRITSRLGISTAVEKPEDRYFNFINTEYTITGTPKVPINVGQVFGLISLGLNNIFRSGTYSIFYLSFIYFVLYIGGFYLFVRNSFNYFARSKMRKILFGLLSVLVLSDIMFVSYFTSFYQEAVFIIAGLYAVALIIAPKIRYNWLFVILLLLSLSKPQNILFLIGPIIIMIWKYRYLNRFVLASSILGSIFFLFFLVKEQKTTNEPNLYEAVFLGLMTTSSTSTQEKILQDLELEEEGYLNNVNRGYWRPNNELVENSRLYNEFYSEVTQGDILRSYLINPVVFFKTAKAGLEELLNNSAQPDHLGNYSKSFSTGGQKTIIQSFWGKYLNILFIPIYCTGLVTLIYCLHKKWKQKFSLCRIEKFFLFLILWIPLLYSAILIAGGINDFVKHNLPVYFIISILFLVLWIYVLKNPEKALVVAKSSRCES